MHIVASLDRINFGVWNAAIAGSAYLRERCGVNTEVWVCESSHNEPISGLRVVEISNTSPTLLRKRLYDRGMTTTDTLFISHGCWKDPTRIARAMKRMGYRWIYVPHGMLEPWSMRHGWLKKQLYFRLLEKRWAAEADAVRAVSRREQINLEQLFPGRVFWAANGVEVPPYAAKDDGPCQFLFLGRLHHKKGVLPLVEAWHACMGDSHHRLVLAGPDEGELPKIARFLRDGNISYMGPVYGEEKTRLLRHSHYFLLPSYSEGFPTSVVEAMSYGLIPLISEGCSFPDVFSESLGWRIEPDKNDIGKRLEMLKEAPFDHSLSRRSHQFIKATLAVEQIAEQLVRRYGQLLKSKCDTEDVKEL